MKNSSFFEQFLYKDNLTCLLCGRDIFGKSYFCLGCQKELTFLDGQNSCIKCGRQTRVGGTHCLDCKSAPNSFDAAKSIVSYNSQIAKLVHLYKDQSNVYLGKIFASYMLPVCQQHFFRTDIVITVPPTSADIKRRGFDHIRQIATHLEKQFGAQFVYDGLIKTQNLLAQKTLDKKSRVLYAQKAYKVCNKKIFNGKNVLIIDDVLTTGATADAISQKLKKCNAASVNVLTFTSVMSVFDKK